MKACSFTGHRIIPEELQSGLSDLIKKAIEYAYSRGCRDFYAGGALGFDTMCEREVLLFRISHRDVRLILLLPCKNQDEKWSDAERQRYEYTLSSADEVVYVSEDYTPDCMKKRNRLLAESCDMMIAYAGRIRSGAHQTVRFATELGREVYNLFGKINR